MYGSVTEDEMKQIFENRKIAQFELLQTTKKLTFNFRINPDEKDKFLQWVSVLSSIEFMVNVDIDRIWIRDNSYDGMVFVIKASGVKENLDRWKSNLDQIASFLNDGHDITYFKNTSIKEEESHV